MGAQVVVSRATRVGLDSCQYFGKTQNYEKCVQVVVSRATRVMGDDGGGDDDDDGDADEHGK